MNEYDDLLIRGRSLQRMVSSHQIEIGELADQVDTQYGQETLLQYAADIGIDYATLKNYRTTYRSWKNEPRRPKSYSVARILNRYPHKQELLQQYAKTEPVDPENPTEEETWQELEETVHDPENWLTVQVAKTEMKKWREERGADKGRNATSEFVAHKRKTQIIRELNQFLSERSPLRAMILEFKDNNMDYYYVDEIINTMLDAEKRIKEIIELLNITVPEKAD
jgi:hypothetical protein